MGPFPLLLKQFMEDIKVVAGLPSLTGALPRPAKRNVLLCPLQDDARKYLFGRTANRNWPRILTAAGALVLGSNTIRESNQSSGKFPHVRSCCTTVATETCQWGHQQLLATAHHDRRSSSCVPD